MLLTIRLVDSSLKELTGCGEADYSTRQFSPSVLLSGSDSRLMDTPIVGGDKKSPKDDLPSQRRR